MRRDYLASRDRNQSFDGLGAGHIGGPMRVRVDAPAQMVPVTPVTGNYFDMRGVSAALPITSSRQQAESRANGWEHSRRS